LIPSISHGEAEYASGRVIYRGAEADLLLGTWEGYPAVFKVRKPLRYRLPVLDSAIRHQRTIREAEMIRAAKKARVEAPNLYFVDPAGSTLVMEHVGGARLRDLLTSASADVVSGVFKLLGSDVGKLHNAGIMHGDLTTANVILGRRSLVFIDFGLSIHTARAEDHAVDLRLIRETLAGAHSALAGDAFKALLEGYESEVGGPRCKAVLGQLRSIERRGRYARVA
jgi:TP53 regulating kinase-like protein